MVKSTLNHLAHNIGISGFKFLLGPDASTIRRICWMLVIVGAVAWMIWNIHGRLIYFLSYPTSLETRMTLHDKIPFPTIVVCNQNRFRSSQVFKETKGLRRSPNMYEAITEYYKVMSGRREHDTGFSDMYGRLLAHTNTKSFQDRMAHDKHTLIQKCSWKGVECSADDFFAVRTDIGTCYQFNQKTQKGNYFVDTAGRENGLSLSLMVEQYDYGRGPRDSAGAVVVISASHETEAFTDSHGVGVTVGSNTAIALKKKTVRDMPSPHGECGERRLDGVPNTTLYTTLRCSLDCLTDFIRERCGCIHAYMLTRHNIPYCGLMDNLQCAHDAKKLFFNKGVSEQCECPAPCISDVFDKTISQTSLSQQYLNTWSLNAAAASKFQGPSLTMVNRAVKIQAWGLLSDFGHGYTETIASIAESLLTTRQALGMITNFITNIENELNVIFYTNHTTVDQPSQNGNVTDRLPTEYDTTFSILQKLKQTLMMMRERFDSPDGLDLGDFRKGLEATIADDIMKPKITSNERLNKHRHFLEMVINRVVMIINEMEKSFDKLLLEIDEDKVPDAKTRMDEVRYHFDLVREKIAVYNKETNFLVNHLRTLPPVDDLVRLRTMPFESLEPSFYRDNLLNVDIYFEELQVEDVVKTEAYSIEGLVCDMGGSIGLCLGGSILTIIEIIDLILFPSKKKSYEDKYEAEDTEKNKVVKVAVTDT